jgi:superfamily II DNA or RNA helicase
MSSYDDLFEKDSEITVKEIVKKKFGEWWSNDDIQQIILYIVNDQMASSIEGVMKNFEDFYKENDTDYREILLDLVGLNFLVNSDKSLRCKFLYYILKSRFEKDSTFQDRFLEYLIRPIKSSYVSEQKCCKCDKVWTEDDWLHTQSLGLEKNIVCSDIRCIQNQQRELVPPFDDPRLKDFILTFEKKRDYKKFVRHLVSELDLPDTVIRIPAINIKLLPDEVEPIGNFNTLYDYQASIGVKIKEMLEHYDDKTSRGLVVLPTGAGKTRLVVESLIDWINGGKKGNTDSKFIVWIVDKNELCQQAFNTFAEIFRHRGKRDTSLKLHPIYDEHSKNIGDVLFQYSDSTSDHELSEQNGVIIASIQSLYSLQQQTDEGSLPELGKLSSIVIIDEAHHASPKNKSYNAVLRSLGFQFKKKEKNINRTRLLGMTATPFRGSDQDSESTKNLLNRFGGEDRILWPPFSESPDKSNSPPHAHLEVQKFAFEKERVKLHGNKSYDVDGRIILYHFKIQKLLSVKNYDPESVIKEIPSSHPDVEFIFKEPGKYLIQLTVKDDEGVVNNFSTNASQTIEILSIGNKEKEPNVVAMKKLYKNLIQKEILAKPHHYVIDHSHIRVKLSESDVEKFSTFHDVGKKTIAKIGEDTSRNFKICEKIKSLVEKEGKKSIILFACSVDHAKLISFMLDAFFKIRSASIDHTTSHDLQNDLIQNFRKSAKNSIKVICNYDILTTGFDAPKVDCVFVARPTYSHLLYNQMTGRGLRGPRSNGTSDCVIVDISDNIQLINDGEDGLVEQSWKIFDYIYETRFDEQKNVDQTCYACFGSKQVIIDGQEIICDICKGIGIIQKNIVVNSKEPELKFSEHKDELMEIISGLRIDKPNLDRTELILEAKKRLKFSLILDRKKLPSKPRDQWDALCDSCGKTSADMGYTLSSFGRDEKNISTQNPKGIFSKCKECRSKQ